LRHIIFTWRVEITRIARPSTVRWVAHPVILIA